MIMGIPAPSEGQQSKGKKEGAMTLGRDVPRKKNGVSFRGNTL